MKIVEIKNKQTRQDVCGQYLNKKIRCFDAIAGADLKVVFEDGVFFTHEVVLSSTQDDNGFDIETTNKLWRIDNN